MISFVRVLFFICLSFFAFAKSTKPVSSSADVTRSDCDPDLICGEAITCIDGLLYPTTCGPDNCNASIGQCEDNDCDSSLACGDAITCIGGFLYPTTCGPENCDGPIGECCEDLAGLNFGMCEMILGYAVVNGVCEGVSGCAWEAGGVDYSDAFFLTQENCEATCLSQGSSCDDIEEAYNAYHEGVSAACDVDNDCQAVWGDCSVGLGGCHYSVNADSYSEIESTINNLVENWLNASCMAGVCDCMDPPYAQCVNGSCHSAYCPGDNPAGCIQTGCDVGYECVVSNECIPSSCSCDDANSWPGEWVCTEDCGGGECVPSGASGDLNNDGTLNVLDVVFLVNSILDSQPSLASGDLNNDGSVNIVDIILLINLILS